LSREHPNVRSIKNILEKDNELKGEQEQLDKPYWEPGSTKFLKLEQKRCYRTDILKDDWRPFFSE